MLEGLAAVGVFSLIPDRMALTRHKSQSFALVFVFSCRLREQALSPGFRRFAPTSPCRKGFTQSLRFFVHPLSFQEGPCKKVD